MEVWSRREDRWVGRGRWQVSKVGFEIEVVWKVEVVCVFGRGWRCGLFAESVSGVMRVRLHHWSAFPVHIGIKSSAPTSPRPVLLPAPALFPIPPISRSVSILIFMSSPSSFS